LIAVTVQRSGGPRRDLEGYGWFKMNVGNQRAVLAAIAVVPRSYHKNEIGMRSGSRATKLFENFRAGWVDKIYRCRCEKEE